MQDEGYHLLLKNVTLIHELLVVEKTFQVIEGLFDFHLYYIKMIITYSANLLAMIRIGSE